MSFDCSTALRESPSPMQEEGDVPHSEFNLTRRPLSQSKAVY